LIGEKIPLIRQVTNFASNPLIRRHIIGDAAVALVLKSRFSLFLGRRQEPFSAAPGGSDRAQANGGIRHRDLFREVLRQPLGNFSRRHRRRRRYGLRCK
jgi:hypothetical protein